MSDGEFGLYYIRIYAGKKNLSLLVAVIPHRARSDSDEALVAVGVAMPPWPGEQEAFFVEGPWTPTVSVSSMSADRLGPVTNTICEGGRDG